MTDDPHFLSGTSSPEILDAELYSSGMRVTYTGMTVNAVLIVLKLISGILGTSAAMIADAAHSFSDVITDIGVLVGLKFLSRPADSDHAYGHGKIEIAISMVMGIVIIITGISLFWSGLQSILLSLRGTFPHKPGSIALIMGFISILSKEALFHYTRSIAYKSGSRTLEANAWHHRSDALSSVGTVIGVGGAIFLGSRWTVLDPIASIFVSILVVRVGAVIGWNAFRELSDESLSRNVRHNIEESIKSIKGVMGYHKLRTRSLGKYVTLDVHVLVDPAISVREGHSIATDVENVIQKTLGNAAFITIHVEPIEKTNEL